MTGLRHGVSPGKSAVAQLAGFLAKYDPAVARVARAARAKLRARLPTATELVYDNYNALVIGYGPSARASEAILSLALYPRWVTLFFLQGTSLPDPRLLLRGSGKLVRHIVLTAAGDLDTAPIQTLIAAALTHADVKLPASGRRVTIIKSVSAKQRPRRPRP